MNKFATFDHLRATFSCIAQFSDFPKKNLADNAIITGLQDPTFNFVQFRKGSKELIEQLKAQGIPLLSFPDEAHAENASNILIPLGLSVAAEVTAHIYKSVSDFQISENQSLQIQRVTTEEDIKAFDHISSVCFGHPQGLAAEFLRGTIGKKDFLLYLGSFNNTPVACAALSCVGGQAGFYWSGVLPEYRKKGFATQMTCYRLEVAKNLGHGTVISQNMPPSMGYYQKLGFQPQGTLPLYFWKP